MFDKIKISKKEYELLQYKSKLLNQLLTDSENRIKKFKQYQKDCDELFKKQDELGNMLSTDKITTDEFDENMKELKNKLEQLGNLLTSNEAIQN